MGTPILKKKYKQPASIRSIFPVKRNSITAIRKIVVNIGTSTLKFKLLACHNLTILKFLDKQRDFTLITVLQQDKSPLFSRLLANHDANGTLHPRRYARILQVPA